MSEEQRLAALERQGLSVAEIVLAMRSSRYSLDEALVLRRAAVARTFDDVAYRTLIGRNVSGVALNTFVDQGDVEVVPSRTTSRRRFAVSARVRQRELSQWSQESPQELQEFSQSLGDFFEKRRDTLNTLACRLHSDSRQARAEFLRLYREADSTFDYPRLDELLELLRERQDVLAPTLIEALNERERYYQSRVLHADDWMRSAVFLERRAVFTKFKKFLTNHRAWIWHLHAPGGTGKTAFLRWLVARYSVVERQNRKRLPTARVDFDLLDLGALHEWPWLVLIPIIQQLNVQLADSPFEKLVTRIRSFEDVVLRAPRRDPATRAQLFQIVKSVAPTLGPGIYKDFALALQGASVLVVLDTVEEMMLHHPEQFAQTLIGWRQIRDDCRGLRLVLAGRYPMKILDGHAALVKTLKRPFAPYRLRIFTTTESRRYLTKIRELKDPALVTKIVTRVKGHPFKLSLCADLFDASGRLDEEDLRRPEVAYLLRRVIERIPEDELALRWTLRYAVISRHLDEEFFDRVLKPHVEREIAEVTAAQRLDSTLKGLPKGAVNPWKYMSDGHIDTAALWKALRKYAGPKSWVVIVGETPRLQPEVVVPMQQLLRGERIFSALHASAADYFRERASRDPGQWAQWTAQEAYHRIQGEGVAGEEYWKSCFSRPEARDTGARQTLTEAVVNSDFLDDKGEARIVAETRRPMVTPPVLAFARLELASAALSEAQANPATASSEVQTTVRELRLLKRLEREHGDLDLDRGRRAFVEASVAALRGTRVRVLSVCRAALAKVPESPYAPLLSALLADQLHRRPLEASGLYDAAVAQLARTSAPLTAASDVLERHARMWFDVGDLDRARELYQLAFADASERADARSQHSAMMSLFEIARASLATHDAADLVSRFGQLSYAAGPDGVSLADRCQAWVAIERGTPLGSFRPADRNEDGAAEIAIWRARDLGNRLRTDEARKMLEDATDRVRQTRPDLVERLTLEKASIVLDILGDARQAGAILSVELVSESNQLTRSLLEMRLRGSLSPSFTRPLWRHIRRTLYEGLSRRMQAYALAHWLAYGITAVRDWREFHELCAGIRPDGARHFLLTPFRNALGPHRGDSVVDLFPDPDVDDPDFLNKALRIASLLRPTRRMDRASMLMAQAFDAVDPRNLVLLGRVVAAAWLVNPEIPPRFLDAALHAVHQNRQMEPCLSAATVLQVSAWQLGQDRRAQAAESFRLACDIRDGGAFKFEGRFASLAEDLRRELKVKASRSTGQAPLPHDAPNVVRVERSGERQISWTVQRPGAVLQGPGQTLRLPEPLFTSASIQQLGSAVQQWVKLSGNPSQFEGGLSGDYTFVCSQELSALPLERLFSFVSARFVYRTPEPRSAVVAQWLRKVIGWLGETTGSSRGWSSRDQAALLRVLHQRQLDKNEPLMETKRQLRIAAARPPSVLMIKAGSATERKNRRGYGAAGIHTDPPAWPGSFYVLTPIDVAELTTRLVEWQPDLIWIVGDFEPSGSEIMLRVEDPLAKAYIGLTPHSLRLALLDAGLKSPPAMLLDVPDDPLRGLQFVLRNRFADGLYQSGSVRSVLAAGLADRSHLQEYYGTVHQAIQNCHCEGELLNSLAPLCVLPPALYSFDPTIPLA